MKKVTHLYNSFRSSVAALRWNQLVLFVPGVFMLLVGAVAIFAPWILVAVLACFCMFLGVLFSFLTYRFLILKSKIELLMRRFEGQVVIQGMGVRPNPTNENIEIDPKKIILH